MLKKNKTLKNKIHNYIAKKRDICCEKDVDRNVVIKLIIEKYKQYSANIDEPEEFLNWINNDLVKFVGYKVELEKKKDIEGVKLCDYLDKQMFEKKVINEHKIKLLLEGVPLYFLLSLLGYGCYIEKLSK
jgi:hypothetical protein